MAKDKPIFYLYPAFIRRLLIGKKFTGCIHLTAKCNLRCKHCYNSENLADDEDISIDEWKKRFLQYRQNGLLFPLFLGGEPSLRYDVLQLAEKIFPFVATFTNGQIRIPEEFDHRIHLSLDGLCPEHDQVRGDGTFERAVENYRGDKRVIINTVLSKMNYKGPERLREWIEYVRGLGVDGMHIEFFFPQKNVPQTYSSVLDDHQYQEIGHVLLGELRRKDSLLFTTKEVLHAQMKNDFPYLHCHIRDDNYVISHENKLIRCVSHDNDCSFCRVREKYNAPLWNIPAWWKIKIARKKYNLL